jgi:uncharacterized membrane-anchored protein YjiN (DUF445 family)
MTENDQPTLANIVTNLENQMGDILGELDTIAKESKTSDRIRALGAKLRHLEMRRHHMETLRYDSMFKETIAMALNTISEDLHKLIQQQSELQVAPGHVVTRFKGMGLQIEASGREDDPHYQALADHIAKISKAITSLKQAIVDHDMAEQTKDREHHRSSQSESSDS